MSTVGRAVFLDKDGTLVDDVPYNADPAQVRLAAGAVTALQRLAAGGFRLIVVSNQPGIGLGYFTAGALRAVETQIAAMLGPDASVAGFYYCPHASGDAGRAAESDCGCRKPRPGLLLRAAAEHAVDLGRSWMVGDILDDVEAGHHAGCRSILLDVGNETEWRITPARRPDAIFRSLNRAADWILADVQTVHRHEYAGTHRVA